MVGNTMSDMLGRRLEDEDLAKFPLVNRIDAINNAMLRLINLLDNDHLEELRTTDDLDPAAGVHTLIGAGGLVPALVRNGIQKVYDNNAGTFMHLVDPMDLEKTANGYLTPSANYIIAYVYGTNLYVDPTTNDVTVWYLGIPNLFSSAGASTGYIAMATACPLNLGLHPIVVDMAEAELWKQDGKSEKAESILVSADKEIETLNQRAVAERKEAMGRKTGVNQRKE